MNLDIEFTDAASEYIRKMVEKDHARGFRLSVRKTGCSGYSYSPSVITAENTADITFVLPNGVTVYVDAAWLSMLRGLRVDYVEDSKSGLKQKRLVFNNPNESSRCGCGESFHIE